MNLYAFLASEAFPIEVIRGGAGLLPRDLGPAVQDDLAWDEALGALRDYSLVEVSGDVLSMHRLVQAVARDRLPPTARRRWAEAAVQLVDDAFPFVEVQTWPTCAQLLPHALIVSGHAQTLQVGDEPAGRLLNQVGFYLQHSGDNARGSLGPGPRGPTDPSRYPVAPGEHRTAAKVPA